MDIKMVKYIIHLSRCEYIDTIEIHHKDNNVSLFDINNIDTMVINETRIDISDYNYLNFIIDHDFHDEIGFELYTYEDFDDAGMDLVYQTMITTKLPTLELFQLL